MGEDLQFSQPDADRRGEEVPHRGEGLEEPEGVRPSPVGHHLGNQRHADGKLPAHPQPGDESIKGEIPKPGRERGESGAERVDDDRDHHRFGAAIAIADDAEDQTAGGPAEEENAGGKAAIVSDVLRIGCRTADSQERFHRRLAGEIEELLVEAIKQPPQRRHHEDEPVIAGHPGPPRLAVVGNRGPLRLEVGQVGHGRGSRGGRSGGEAESVAPSRRKSYAASSPAPTPRM